jgi:hypothetical protein
MAKEMILVPKVKYERLLQKLEPVDTSSRENDQSSRQTPGDQVQSDSDLMDKTNLLQSGTGYVTKKKKVGKPPGFSNVRRKKKHVPWLTY